MKKKFITRMIGIILTICGNTIVFNLTDTTLKQFIAVLMIYFGGALVMWGSME